MTEGLAVERLQETAGPIVVKEVRQGLRSKVFTIFFSLLLLACFSISLIAVAVTSNSYSNTGQNVLLSYLVVLGGVCYFVIPYQAFRSMLREREDETWVLLALTGLGGRSIIRGKYVSAMSQALLFGSACAPFVVFSYYLNGVDILQIVVALTMSAAWTSLLVAMAVFIAAEAKTRMGRAVAHFVVLGLLLAALIPAFAASVALAEGLSGSDVKPVLFGSLALFGLALENTALLLVAGGVSLSLSTDHDAIGPRRLLMIFSAINVFVTAMLCIAFDAPSEVAEVAGVFFALSLLPWTVGAISEGDGWSRSRANECLWKPGALRSATSAWTQLALGAIAFFALANVLSSPRADASGPLIPFVGAGYVILFTAAGAFWARVTPLSRLGEPVASRVAFIICTAFAIVISPIVQVVLNLHGDERRAIHALNPLVGMVESFDSATSREFMVFIVIGATTLALITGWIALRNSDVERAA